MTAFRGCASRLRFAPTSALFIALLALTWIAGCAENTGGRVPVAGTVTLNGTPLEQGTIEFHPTGDGTITGGTIREGRFDIPAAQGAKPGEYEVRIYAADTAGEPMEDPNVPPGESERPLQPELIPERYNVQTELTADIEEGGSTELTYELES